MPSHLRFALAVLTLCTAAPLYAEDVDAGIDLWKTLPESGTQADLTLPAGFFTGSSLLVDATIQLKGAPVETKPGTPSLGMADTVIERMQDAHPVTCGESDTVPLRIRALHLVGKNPLTVSNLGGGVETWSVEVFLSDALLNGNQTGGSITIRQNCNKGGTFDSRVKVRPKFIFTRTTDQFQRVLDWFEYPDLAQEITFGSTNSYWARRGPAGFALMTAEPGAIVDANHDGTWEDGSPLPGTTSDFVVGARPQPCYCASPDLPVLVHPEPVDEDARLANHHVDPPTSDATSFPRHRDRDRGERDGIERDGKQSALGGLPFLSLGLLALAIAVAAVRR